MKSYTVRYRDGTVAIIEAANPEEARSKAESWYATHVRYYGSSRIGRGWEAKARRGYVKNMRSGKVEQ